VLFTVLTVFLLSLRGNLTRMVLRARRQESLRLRSLRLRSLFWVPIFRDEESCSSQWQKHSQWQSVNNAMKSYNLFF